MRAINANASAIDDNGRMRLIEQEVARLSGMVNRLALQSGEMGNSQRPVADLWHGAPPATSFASGRARMVREKIRQRRQRERHFPSDLFADPAWDMLLDLYAAHYEGRAISVSSLCIAAAVPATTALRWIKTMTDAGHFTRSHDTEDGRRVFIKISDEARAGMDDYFDEIGA